MADAGELKTANDFQVMALNALALGESVEEERQGIIVMNPLYELSNGSVSEMWRNA